MVVAEIAGPVASSVLTVFILKAIQGLGKQRNLPKQVQRLNAIMPVALNIIQVFMDVVIGGIRSQIKQHENGEADELRESLERAVTARDTLQEFLSERAISQKN